MNLITYAENGRIEIGAIEDDSGELTQIGRFIWPEGYGLTEAAILCTNLSQFLQLNGHKPKKRASTPPELEAGPSPVVTERKRETPRERTNRLARESYARNRAAGMTTQEAINNRTIIQEPLPDVDVVVMPKPRGRPKGGSNPGRHYISLDEIVALVIEHPGSTTAELGRIYNGGSVVDWVTKAFANRLQDMRNKPNPPLRYEKRQTPGTDKAPVYHYWPADALASLPEPTPAPAPVPAPKKVTRFIDSKDLVALVEAHPGLTALEVAHLYSPGPNDPKLNKMVTDRLRAMSLRGEVNNVREDIGHGAAGYRYRYHPV